jgi:hypothetical protein
MWLEIQNTYTSRLFAPFMVDGLGNKGLVLISSLSDPRGGYAPAEPPEALTSQLEPVQPGMEC